MPTAMRSDLSISARRGHVLDVRIFPRIVTDRPRRVCAVSPYGTYQRARAARRIKPIRCRREGADRFLLRTAQPSHDLPPKSSLMRAAATTGCISQIASITCCADVDNASPFCGSLPVSPEDTRIKTPTADARRALRPTGASAGVNVREPYRVLTNGEIQIDRASIGAAPGLANTCRWDPRLPAAPTMAPRLRVQRETVPRA